MTRESGEYQFSLNSSAVSGHFIQVSEPCCWPSPPQHIGLASAPNFSRRDATPRSPLHALRHRLVPLCFPGAPSPPATSRYGGLLQQLSSAPSSPYSLPSTCHTKPTRHRRLAPSSPAWSVPPRSPSAGLPIRDFRTPLPPSSPHCWIRSLCRYVACVLCRSVDIYKYTAYLIFYL